MEENNSYVSAFRWRVKPVYSAYGKTAKPRGTNGVWWLSSFNTFFTGVANAFPSYNDNCSSGFKVIYTDELGSVYTSRADSSTYKDVKFSNIRQDSDATGDYSKFTSTFNCYVYYESGTLPLQGKDSLKIQMGRLKGYFKR